MSRQHALITLPAAIVIAIMSHAVIAYADQVGPVVWSLESCRDLRDKKMEEASGIVERVEVRKEVRIAHTQGECKTQLKSLFQQITQKAIRPTFYEQTASGERRRRGGSGNRSTDTTSNSSSSSSGPAPDVTAPIISTLSPADNATGTLIDTDLVITFTETIASTGTGTVSIYLANDDSLVEQIAVTGSLVTGSGTTSITIDPTSDLQSSTGYYIQISDNAFPDAAGNFFAGISDTTTWNFTTGDQAAPVISTLSPADNATGADLNTNLVITFDEAIGTTGTGTVSIYKANDDSLVETIAVTGSLVTGSGTTSITINPSVTLAANTGYYIQISATAFPDASGNFYAGISNTTTWNFTTTALDLGMFDFSLATHMTDLLWQEIPSGVQITNAVSDDDPVGTLIDNGKYASEINIDSTVRRPLLDSDGNRNSFLVFDGDNDLIEFDNSDNIFQNIPSGSGFTIMLWIKSNGDDTTYTIFDSTTGLSTGNNGIYLRKNSTNTMSFAVMTARAGKPLISYTTPSTDAGRLTVSDGWTPIIIRSNGTTGTFQLGDAAPAAMTVTTANKATYGASATGTFTIGAKSGVLGEYMNASLGTLAINIGEVSSDADADFLTYNPARSSASPAKIYASSGTLLPTQLSHLQYYWDLSDDGRKFTDLAGTTLVSSGDDPIGRILEKRNRALNRDLVADSTSTRPLHKTSVVNGEDVPLWDGVDDNFSFDTWTEGGSFSLTFAAKNNDTATGSHFLKGSLYIVQTGEEYEDGSGADARFVIHTAGDSFQFGKDANVGQEMDGDGWNIYTLIRDVDSWQVRVNGVDATGAPFTDASQFSPADMGLSNNGPSWLLEGYVAEMMRYGVAHSTEDIAKLERYLASKYAITLGE